MQSCVIPNQNNEKLKITLALPVLLMYLFKLKFIKYYTKARNDVHAVKSNNNPKLFEQTDF